MGQQKPNRSFSLGLLLGIKPLCRLRVLAQLFLEREETESAIIKLDGVKEVMDVDPEQAMFI